MFQSALELLAPARDVEVARQAVLHGADAVYIGGPSHGARAAAANDMAQIAALTAWAHQYDVKIYLTLNTIFYDSEAAEVERIVREAYAAGVDALIIQDMGILRLDIPPIELHASTQCNIRTPQKARFLSDCGFTQLVLPRELSLAEIREMRAAAPGEVRLEAFVHGALCVSYSGDCQASCMANGRSANRGECAQMCRMAYNVLDGQGRVLLRDKHVLSLRDLCRLDHIEELADAGITSFKIEGRLKDAAYVKNAVAAYRRAIDQLIAKHPERYYRASQGSSIVNFEPDVNKAFNRGYTRYFVDGKPTKPVSMANLDTPKWVGERVGKVIKHVGKDIIASLTAKLANGDGIGYYDGQGQFCGFRLNRIEGNRLFPASAVRLAPGTVLYRNHDAQREALMSKPTATRPIPVDMTLSHTAAGIALRVEREDGQYAIATAGCKVEAAKTPQTEARRRTLAKLGETIHQLGRLEDQLDESDFVPASVLTQLRREAVSALAQAVAATYIYAYRRKEDKSVQWPGGNAVTYHDNVANQHAAQFYREHGVERIERAAECSGGSAGECGGDIKHGDAPEWATARPDVVMTTRYCLRRELGACLLEGGAKQLPEPLYIENRAARYRLRFDCQRCQMQVEAPPTPLKQATQPSKGGVPKRTLTLVWGSSPHAQAFLL